MSTKTMTMHRLLAEIKTYDDRIHRAMHDGQFVHAAKKSLTKIGAQTPDELKTDLIGNLKSVRALIANKKALEAVKMASNAVTLVIIGDKEYTVADAIKRKADIHYEKELLQVLISQYNDAVRNTNSNNEKMTRSMESQISNLFGGAEKATEKTEEIERYTKMYQKDNEWDIIDPNGIIELINTMKNEITTFVTEVDAVLSESNAITTVSVEFAD